MSNWYYLTSPNDDVSESCLDANKSEIANITLTQGWQMAVKGVKAEAHVCAKNYLLIIL